ncbi:hypothetical protein MP228_011037 [Amoeboaphelidium protococcarum]|nr:hypothetical protein MP228_011037 [Amoeboaphelidium protococcarum]
MESNLNTLIKVKYGSGVKQLLESLSKDEEWLVDMSDMVKMQVLTEILKLPVHHLPQNLRHNLEQRSALILQNSINSLVDEVKRLYGGDVKQRLQVIESTVRLVMALCKFHPVMKLDSLFVSSLNNFFKVCQKIIKVLSREYSETLRQQCIKLIVAVTPILVKVPNLVELIDPQQELSAYIMFHLATVVSDQSIWPGTDVHSMTYCAQISFHNTVLAQIISSGCHVRNTQVLTTVMNFLRRFDPSRLPQKSLIVDIIVGSLQYDVDFWSKYIDELNGLLECCHDLCFVDMKYLDLLTFMVRVYHDIDIQRLQVVLSLKIEDLGNEYLKLSRNGTQFKAEQNIAFMPKLYNILIPAGTMAESVFIEESQQVLLWDFKVDLLQIAMQVLSSDTKLQTTDSAIVHSLCCHARLISALIEHEVIEMPESVIEFCFNLSSTLAMNNQGAEFVGATIQMANIVFFQAPSLVFSLGPESFFQVDNMKRIWMLIQDHAATGGTNCEMYISLLSSMLHMLRSQCLVSNVAGDQVDQLALNVGKQIALFIASILTAGQWRSSEWKCYTQISQLIYLVASDCSPLLAFKSGEQSPVQLQQPVAQFGEIQSLLMNPQVMQCLVGNLISLELLLGVDGNDSYNALVLNIKSLIQYVALQNQITLDGCGLDFAQVFDVIMAYLSNEDLPLLTLNTLQLVSALANSTSSSSSSSNCNLSSQQWISIVGACVKIVSLQSSSTPTLQIPAYYILACNSLNLYVDQDHVKQLINQFKSQLQSKQSLDIFTGHPLLMHVNLSAINRWLFRMSPEVLDDLCQTVQQHIEALLKVTTFQEDSVNTFYQISCIAQMLYMIRFAALRLKSFLIGSFVFSSHIMELLGYKVGTDVDQLLNDLQEDLSMNLEWFRNINWACGDSSGLSLNYGHSFLYDASPLKNCGLQSYKVIEEINFSMSARDCRIQCLTSWAELLITTINGGGRNFNQKLLTGSLDYASNLAMCLSGSSLLLSVQSASSVNRMLWTVCCHLIQNLPVDKQLLNPKDTLKIIEAIL